MTLYTFDNVPKDTSTCYDAWPRSGADAAPHARRAADRPPCQWPGGRADVDLRHGSSYWRCPIRVAAGHCRRILSLSIHDLRRMPAVSRMHFIECSGNGLTEWSKPTLKTVQGTHGLTSTSEWTGVLLSTVLREAGIQGGAAWLLAEGSDAAVPHQASQGPPSSGRNWPGRCRSTCRSGRHARSPRHASGSSTSAESRDLSGSSRTPSRPNRATK